MGAHQRLLVVTPIQWRRTLVQHHGDVRPQCLLDRHHLLRREAVGAAVEVAAKGDALRVHFPLVGQAEDLVAARIGEQRAIPAHKGVQPAKTLDQLVARPQIEMIGVGQHQLRAAFMEVARLQGLDVGLGAHGGKGRHRDGAVGRVKGAQPGQAVGLVQFKSKRHGHFLMRSAPQAGRA